MSTPELSPPRGAGRSRIGTATRVSGSQILLAGSGYVVLAMSGHLLNPAMFAAATSFYLLLNTVGRGLSAAVELHLTRAVARDLACGRPLAAAQRVGAKQTAVLLAVSLLVVLVGSPVITKVFAHDGWLTVQLAVSMPGMAYAYMQRGLLAGARRYNRYALSFAVEAITTLVVGSVLMITGTHGTHWWVLAFVLGPAVSVAVLLLLHGRSRPRVSYAGTAATGAGDLVWSVVVLGCAQGVWNLAPVVLTWRLTASPGIAAGFTSMALILRIPILFFPAAQALLLPVLTASSGTVGAQVKALLPKLLAGTVVVVALWGVLAAVVAPVVVRVVFGQDAVPSVAVALILAGASVLGGIAQLLQTALVAKGGYRRSGLGWIAALAVLVLLGTVPPASSVFAATSLVVAAAVAVLWFAPLQGRRTFSRTD